MSTGDHKSYSELGVERAYRPPGMVEIGGGGGWWVGPLLHPIRVARLQGRELDSPDGRWNSSPERRREEQRVPGHTGDSPGAPVPGIGFLNPSRNLEI